MKKNELIKDIKFYILYLSNCFTSYLLSERINDWYENNEELLRKSNLYLSFSCDALIKDFVNTFYSLFTKSDNDNSLYKLYHKIENQRKTTEWLTPSIREQNSSMINEIEKQSEIVKTLSNWRCDFYAHITNKSFNPDCFDKYRNDNRIESDKAMDLVYYCYRCLNVMLVELKEKPIPFIYTNCFDIDKIFSEYCKTIPPKFTVDVFKYK